MEDILVPLFFFVFLGAIIIVPRWLRSRDRRTMLDTVRTAYERGAAIPPELIAAIQVDKAGPAHTPQRDLRGGVILIGVALGLVGIGLAQGAAGRMHVLWDCVSGATVPGFIGLGLLLLWWLNRRAAL